MINKKSPIPMYYQLEQYIRSMVEDGTLKVKDPLPSVRELSEKYKISRMTVRQAITNLVNEGLLISIKGSGTFVADKKIEKGPSVYSFTEEMRRMNMVAGAKILEFQIIPALETIASRLGIAVGDQVFEITRLRLADNEPMALEIAYVPYHFLDGLEEKQLEEKGSLYELFQERGLDIVNVERTIEASIASTEEAKLLHIKSKAPVLLVIGRTFSKNNQIIEYVKSIYRADRYKFNVNFNTNGSFS